MDDQPSCADVELETPRLLLRAWRPEDAEPSYRALQDRRMHEFLTLPDPYTMSDALTYVTEIGNADRVAGTGLGCAVVERSTGRLAGSAELRFSRTKLLGADIGYLIHPWAQGNGYAAEATRALTDWGHARGIRRIELRCAVTNLPSAATALAAGFRFEGIERAQLATPSGDRDAACFSRLATDPATATPPAFPRLGVLEDELVQLRVLAPSDARACHEQDADPESVRFGLFPQARPFPATVELTERAGLEWLTGSTASFAVLTREDAHFAAAVRLSKAGPPLVGRLGYAAHPDFRGRGIATRAVRLVSQWAFEVAGMARLELGAKVDNVASQRVALGAGFTEDGVRAARLRNSDGTFSDEARFVRLRA